jgi:hypothetical protein
MKKLTTIGVAREQGESKAQPQTGASPLRRLLEPFGMPSWCPKCGTKGFRAGVYACQSCGWREPTPPAQSGRRVGVVPGFTPALDAPVSVASALAIKDRDPAATFRTARIVALIAAIIAGALTATHWYSVSGVVNGFGEPVRAAHGLWTDHPAIGALIVVGAVLVVATCAASLFRVPSDRPNLSPVALGFAALAALVGVVSSVVGLTDAPPASTFGLPSDVFHVADSVGAIFTLAMALIALGGTTIMFLAGREDMSKASAPSVAESSDVTEPESRESAALTHITGQDSDGDPVKRCPECAEWVKDAAHVCRYCGFRFASTAEPTNKP